MKPEELGTPSTDFLDTVKTIHMQPQIYSKSYRKDNKKQPFFMRRRKSSKSKKSNAQYNEDSDEGLSNVEIHEKDSNKSAQFNPRKTESAGSDQSGKLDKTPSIPKKWSIFSNKEVKQPNDTDVSNDGQKPSTSTQANVMDGKPSSNAPSTSTSQESDQAETSKKDTLLPSIFVKSKQKDLKLAGKSALFRAKPVIKRKKGKKPKPGDDDYDWY